MREKINAKNYWTRMTCLVFVGLMSASDISPCAAAETPSPSTGIEGVISIGPNHGGPIHQGVSDSIPFAHTAFVVENETGVVVTFTTDEEGRFRVSLPPGAYTVTVADMKTKKRKCRFQIEVDISGFKKVQHECDSGIR